MIFALPAVITGIIPARAGFTLAGVAVEKVAEDHPRSRGVYVLLPAPYRDALGSSPLARGLRDWGASELTARGIIPARAGFTCAVGYGL